MRKLKISYSKKPLLTVTRSRRWSSRMVYILVGNRYFPYKDLRSKTVGWSSILYIGTTKKGPGRPAASAVSKASEVFYHLHGVRTIDVYIVTSAAHNVKLTWKKLEAALIDAFWKRYFDLPRCNKVKPKHSEGPFGSRALTKLIARFEKR
jgi:hypothetical protein